MRKAVKNNLLEIFKTIYEAHEIVKGFIDKKEYENAQNLLAVCQDTAIQLGNLIEESEGEGFVTVSFLEEYCEALYEVATNLSDETNGHKVQKQLDKKIIKAENSAKNDIKVKLEVVFMPYKASMWDSLESVWKAADEDPACDAYVVPIPYYDRNPDHSFGEFHYEGGDYPDYVPVVHYEAYNLEQRRPDVIYIHNPYDGNNYVTSVDPRFYSSELKKYTDKLVYIPYFVLVEPDPDNEQTVEAISHFVTVSGVINADKVIVQSEAMRQVYIKVLLGRFGDTPNNRKLVEDKIDGTGSPKFDKAMSTDRNNVNIPEEWKSVLYKKDGTRKKVVMYNTGISALLEYGEKWLDKIENTLEIFNGFSEDIVLLWRPHPVLENTMKSMQPQLLARYMKIKNDFKWGILDSSADLDRTIAISDAFYGDPSSVAMLFKKCQKPIFISNVMVYANTDIKINLLEIVGYATVGKTMFCVSYKYNLIFKINAETFELEDIIELNDNIGKISDCQILQCIDKLVIAMYSEKKIYVCDLTGNIIDCFSYDSDNIDASLSCCGVDNTSVTFFRRSGGGFVTLDVDSMVISQHNVSNVPISFTGICRDESGVFSAKLLGNEIYEISVLDGGLKKIYTGTDRDRFWQVIKNGNLFILTHYQNPSLTIWNAETGLRKDITEFPENFNVYGDVPYADILQYDNEILIFPRSANMILKLNFNNFSVMQFGKVYTEKECRMNVYKYHITESNGYALAFNFVNDAFEQINLENAEIVTKEIRISEMFQQYLYNISLFDSGKDKGDDIVEYYESENVFILLNDFLHFVRNMSAEKKIKSKMNVGNVIYNLGNN